MLCIRSATNYMSIGIIGSSKEKLGSKSSKRKPIACLKVTSVLPIPVATMPLRILAFHRWHAWNCNALHDQGPWSSLYLLEALQICNMHTFSTPSPLMIWHLAQSIQSGNCQKSWTSPRCEQSLNWNTRLQDPQRRCEVRHLSNSKLSKPCRQQDSCADSVGSLSIPIRLCQSSASTASSPDSHLPSLACVSKLC